MCERCNDSLLEGAFTFNGQNARCITLHNDFAAFTNRTVLLEVALLLKVKESRRYRRQAGTSENEYAITMLIYVYLYKFTAMI